MVVSESLENYLRIIYEIQLEKDVARIKDIIKKLSVKTSSAVQAVKKLAEKGFVVHEKHGYVKLTQRGIMEAQKIYQRHKMLFKFLYEILELDEREAELLACGIEHHVTEKFHEKLERLVECLSEDEGILKTLKRYIREGCDVNLRLSDVEIGKKVKIVKISGDPRVKSRLLSMGLLPGVELVVERVAPLGDPLEVRVKDYKISLRKDEAGAIFVEKEE